MDHMAWKCPGAWVSLGILAPALLAVACNVDSKGFSPELPGSGGAEADAGGRAGSGGATAGGQGGTTAKGGSGGGGGGQGGSSTDGAPGFDGPAGDAGRDAPAPLDTMVVKGAQGAPCEDDDACTSGFCVDGVCCNVRCGGACQACVMAKTGQASGTCRPVSAGTDPDGECNGQPASSCGRTGQCDGMGACALHPAGTVCVSSTCSDGTYTPTRRCDGMGTCQTATARPCDNGLSCENATTCRTSCRDHGDCMSDDFCDPSDGRCKPKKATGAACTSALAGKDCTSDKCVDGVCCENGCSGTCMACAMAKTGQMNGKCAPVTNGADPDGECGREDPSTCGRDGMCDGAGACRKYADGTVCGTLCCRRGGPGVRPCSYVCSGGSCDTSDPMPGQSCGNGACCCQESNQTTCKSPLECTNPTCF